MGLTIEKAAELAASAHRNQKDAAGEPYILHPMRVSLKVFDRTKSADYATVALLHDALEDSDISLDQLKKLGMTDDQLRAMQALTKRPGEEYEAYITRLMQTGGPIAREVKLADLEDNMDIRRLKGRRMGLTDGDNKRLNNYLQAWTRLTGQ